MIKYTLKQLTDSFNTDQYVLFSRLRTFAYAGFLVGETLSKAAFTEYSRREFWSLTNAQREAIYCFLNPIAMEKKLPSLNPVALTFTTSNTPPKVIPEAFDPELKYSRHEEGLPVKKYEYGVRYPDGKVEWHVLGPEFTDLSRWRFLNQWNIKREELHQKNEGTLVFLRRVATTTFSKPTDLPSPTDPQAYMALRIKDAQQTLQTLIAENSK